MSMLREIREISPAAADVLGKAGFDSDPDILSLTRQDLNELFPGAKRLRMRKTISDLIQNAKPINTVLKELLEFIPEECGKEALSKNGVLNDLLILRDLKTKVENLHSLLEEKEKAGLRSMSADFEPSCATVERHFYYQAQPTVKIQTVARGDLFDCDKDLLERVKQKGGLQVEDATEYLFERGRWATPEEKANVTVVFSSISYCLPDDYMIEIEVAMNNVAEYLPGGAPVIMVFMHLTDDADCPDIIRSLGSDPRLPTWHIEDFVNVLYWPNGLLTCPINEQAVAQLHSALLKHSRVVSPAAVAASGSSNSHTAFPTVMNTAVPKHASEYRGVGKTRGRRGRR